MLTAPTPSIGAFGGAAASLAAQSPTCYAGGHDSTGEWAAALVAPFPALSAYGGTNAGLSAPKPTLAITATVTGWGSAALSSPAAMLSATGTTSIMADATLNTPSPNLIGYGGAVCSVTLTGGPTLQATGTAGAIGGAQVTCPLFQFSASGSAQNYGGANLLAPSAQIGATAQAWLIAPGATLTAIGHAVITATYEAYAINLNHAPDKQSPVDEMTHYTNFPFNGIVRYQGSYYGWGADGLYLLEGTTDDAAEIPYIIKTCIDDFKLTNEKNVVSAYFAGRIGPDMTVTLYAGEDGQTSYDYHTAHGTQARTHREKFGRGVTGRYFALGVSGEGALELADIELEINKLNRRI